MKRKFKSILCALLCLALAFSLSACKKAEQPVLQEVAPGHLVSCNSAELEAYRRRLEKR